MRIVFLAAVATATLSACALQQTSAEETAMPDAPPQKDLSSCQGEAYADAIGKFLIAGTAGPGEVNVDDLPLPHRVMKPGMAYTMDFNPERLILEVDETGRIIDVRCG